MKIFKVIIYLFTLVGLTSCGLLYQHIQEKLIAPDTKSVMELEQTVCLGNNRGDLVLSSETENLSQKASNIIDKKYYTFQEKIVLFILLHAYARPDIVGPHSSIQILIREDKNINFFKYSGNGPKKDELKKEEFNKDNSYLLFYTLEKILTSKKGQKSLGQLIGLMDYGRTKIQVSKAFNRFLESNIRGVKDNTKLKELYMKGEQVLQEGESMPVISLIPSYKNYLKKKKGIKYKNQTFLFPIDTDKNDVTAHCNFDGALYKKNIYIIKPNSLENSLALSIFQGKNKNALINLSQNLKSPLTTVKDDVIFQSTPSNSSASFCALDSKERQYFLISNKSRDPSQFLFNLITQKIDYSNETPLHSSINSARRLKLFLPERIVIESKREASDQLDQYLSGDIPVYHSRRLGLIWGQVLDKKKDQLALYLDNRWESSFTCPASK